MNDKTNAPVARLSGVSLRYGKTLGLNDVTLDLPSGCMVGLIGPDGVGKSSLFSLVAGAHVIQTGQVEVLGGDMARAQPPRSSLSTHSLYAAGAGEKSVSDPVGL